MRRAALCLIIIFTIAGCWRDGSPSDFITLDPGPFRAAYLIPDPDAAFDHMELIFQAGEMDNTGPEGLAHYVEHLAWLPQLDRSGQQSSRHSNAWTSMTATGYFTSGPATDHARNLQRLVSVIEPFSLPPHFMRE